MNLHSTDFELFGLPARFTQDSKSLHTRWKALQGQVHPDRFALDGPSAQRLAAQWSARINEAYRRLKDPLKRAAYLCELNGAPIQAESNTAMPAEFLMQQMALREQMDEARSAPELDQLETQVEQLLAALMDKIAQQIDTQQDWHAAAQSVRALMFLDRLVAELERQRAALD